MTRRCEWRHAPEVLAENFGEFEKSQSGWVPGSEEEGWLSLACRGLVAGAHVLGLRWGADGKVSIERFCFSPYVEKPFNSKVIKSFVPEQRIRKCFCVSGFLCSIYICYEHSTYVSHIRVWVCYRSSALNKRRKIFCFTRQWSGRPGFNRRSCYTKDFKNGTWYHLA